MKIVFLGTSSGVPTLDRNVSSTAFITDNKRIWLVDCGEATQHQFLKAKLAFSRIDRVLITHLHGDHCYGLPGLLAMCSMKKCEQPIEVIGPVGIKRYLETVFEISELFFPFKITIIELEPGKSHELGWKQDIVDEGEEPNEFLLSAYPLQHRVKCFGYVIKEKPLQGQFQSQKAIEQGVPKGPSIAQMLKEGFYTFSDGKVLSVKECLGESLPGRLIVILGDTSNSDQIIEAAKNCDVLVHECTFDASMLDRAEKSMHSTSTMVGEFSLKVQPKTLIITHFSMRYTSAGVSPNVQDLLQETKNASPGIQVFAADDLWTFDIQPRWKKKSAIKVPRRKSNEKEEVVANLD